MGAVGPYYWVARGAKESGWVGEFGFFFELDGFLIFRVIRLC